MSENKNPQESLANAPQAPQTPAESAVAELSKNPEALRDLAKNPDFQRSLDALKSNPVVKEALDRMWNAALVSLFRAGFDKASPEKQSEMVRALPETERLVLVFHVRSYDRDNGSDLPAPNPNDPSAFANSPEAVNAVAASMRRSVETGRNAEILKSADIRGRFDSLKAQAKESAASDPSREELAKSLEKMDVSTMTEKDVSSLRAMGADLSKLFLIDASGTPCQGKDAIVKASSNLEPGKSSGLKFVVDFGKNDRVNRAVGAGDILPDEVDRVKINGTEGTKKLDPRPGFYDANGRYLPIFDGYTVEVLSSKELSEADKKAAMEAHSRRFEEIVSDETADLIRDATSSDRMVVKASNSKEAEALANVLSASLGFSDNPEEVRKLREALMKDGVDLGKQGPYAEKISAFAEKMAEMGKKRGELPGIPVDGIVSGPAERSPSGNTLCSKTARENGERLFGMRLPRGNAIDVQNGYGPEGLRHSADPTKSPIEISNGLPPSDPKANFADVFTGSKSEY